MKVVFQSWQMPNRQKMRAIAIDEPDDWCQQLDLQPYLDCFVSVLMLGYYMRLCMPQALCPQLFLVVDLPCAAVFSVFNYNI